MHCFVLGQPPVIWTELMMYIPCAMSRLVVETVFWEVELLNQEKYFFLGTILCHQSGCVGWKMYVNHKTDKQD